MSRSRPQSRSRTHNIASRTIRSRRAHRTPIPRTYSSPTGSPRNSACETYGLRPEPQRQRCRRTRTRRLAAGAVGVLCVVFAHKSTPNGSEKTCFLSESPSHYQVAEIADQARAHCSPGAALLETREEEKSKSAYCVPKSHQHFSHRDRCCDGDLSRRFRIQFRN